MTHVVLLFDQWGPDWLNEWFCRNDWQTADFMLMTMNDDKDDTVMTDSNQISGSLFHF